jgi:hypothetical protein
VVILRAIIGIYNLAKAEGKEKRGIMFKSKTDEYNQFFILQTLL